MRSPSEDFDSNYSTVIWCSSVCSVNMRTMGTLVLPIVNCSKKWTERTSHLLSVEIIPGYRQLEKLQDNSLKSLQSSWKCSSQMRQLA